MNLPRIILDAHTHRIDALIARTDEDRALGLMHCTSLAPDEGMLFVHDEPIDACFWMKNTPMDLSVAFIDDSGEILNTEEMVAHCLEGVRAAAPVRLVLEMRSGWFDERKISRGPIVSGLPLPPASYRTELVAHRG